MPNEMNRLIFSYQDGSRQADGSFRTVSRDATAIYLRARVAARKAGIDIDDVVSKLVSTDPPRASDPAPEPGEPIASDVADDGHEAEAVEALAQILPVMRDALQVKDFDDDPYSGLTVPETLELVSAFMTFMHDAETTGRTSANVKVDGTAPPTIQRPEPPPAFPRMPGRV